ncbi:MAG: hypothetical protein ACRDG3_10475, partial [Tepidiformaceae bacterium]
MFDRRLPVLLCIAAAALLLALGAACSSNTTGKPTPAPGSSATTAPTSSPGRVQTGSDAEFVQGMCAAAQGFVDQVTNDTQSLLTPQPGADGTPAATPDFGSAFFALFQAIAPAYGKFADQVGKLKPPPDLADWFQQAQPRMAAAATALKDGNFDDPSLQDISTEPFPAMPDGPRERLQGVAAKTKECDGLDVFAPESPGSGTPSQYSQKSVLQAAATGTWTGPYGTLKFNTDGTADFDIKLCGISSDSTNPFGVDDSCNAQKFKGKVTEDDHGFEVADADGSSNGLQAYVDGAGKLHVGVGTIG